MECTWQVEIENKLNFALGGYVIKVLFNDFELQQDQALSLTRCPCDNLTFHDGYLESSLYLGSFCGTVHPEVIYSTGNNLSIMFHTDSEMSFRGFNISVSVVKAGTEKSRVHWNHILVQYIFANDSGAIETWISVHKNRPLSFCLLLGGNAFTRNKMRYILVIGRIHW